MVIDAAHLLSGHSEDDSPKTAELIISCAPENDKWQPLFQIWAPSTISDTN